MKRTSAFVFTVLVIAYLLTMGLKSCKGKDSFVSRQDTVQIVGRQQDNTTFIDSAIRSVARVFKKKDESDSNSTDGKFEIQTTYRLLQMVDTLRDSLNHPLFYPNHNPRLKFKYAEFHLTDSLSKYIELVDIPMWPTPTFGVLPSSKRK